MAILSLPVSFMGMLNAELKTTAQQLRVEQVEVEKFSCSLRILQFIDGLPRLICSMFMQEFICKM